MDGQINPQYYYFHEFQTRKIWCSQNPTNQPNSTVELGYIDAKFQWNQVKHDWENPRKQMRKIGVPPASRKGTNKEHEKGRNVGIWVSPMKKSTYANMKLNKRPKWPHIVHLSTMCHLFLGIGQGGHFFCLLIGPKNTNLVEDAEILLPVKFHWISLQRFQTRSRKCLSQSEARAALLFFQWWIGPKNTNLVQDVEILLPVKFSSLVLSYFRRRRRLTIFRPTKRNSLRLEPSLVCRQDHRRRLGERFLQKHIK